MNFLCCEVTQIITAQIEHSKMISQVLVQLTFYQPVTPDYQI